jgi:hypothetical protein
MYNKLSDCEYLQTENILLSTCLRLHIDRVKTKWLPFPSFLQKSLSFFGPALLANQITSNAGFISISLFGPGQKKCNKIGTILRQAIVLLIVAGAFL